MNKPGQHTCELELKRVKKRLQGSHRPVPGECSLGTSQSTKVTDESVRKWDFRMESQILMS